MSRSAGGQQIRKKLLETGWMKNRKNAIPLEELLRLAEVTKQTDEAVEVMDKEITATSVNMVGSNEHAEMIAAFNRFSKARTGNRSKSSSGESKSNSVESKSSSGKSKDSATSGLSLEFIECWYCKREHRGGWFYCSQRKRDDPTWRPRKKWTPSDNSKRPDFR